MEQARDELVNLRRHPKVMLLLAIIFGGWLVLQVLNPEVAQLEDLRAGDCIYVPTSSSGDIDAVRPIGAAGEVVAGLSRPAPSAPSTPHGPRLRRRSSSRPGRRPFPGARPWTSAEPACEAALRRCGPSGEGSA